MSLTKTDYELIGEALGKQRRYLVQLNMLHESHVVIASAMQLADVFEKDNEKFDRERFLALVEMVSEKDQA